MGMIAEREVGRFYAEDDLGKRYTVVRWQDMIVFRPSSRAGKENPRQSSPQRVSNSTVALMAAS